MHYARRVLALTLLVALSVWLRLGRYDAGRNVANLDATYHVLLTVDALQHTPVAEHHLLPIATLGRAEDKGVPFGAAIPDARGNYYYTSFPPLGFIAPYLFFQVTRLDVTPRNLMLFNLAVHVAATLLLCVLVGEALTALRVDDRWSDAIVLLAAATYLFTREPAYSHGVVYWHHSLFQIAWLAQLLGLFRIVSGNATRRRDTVLLVAASVLGPSIEWTGYLANVATAFALWNQRLRRAALTVGVATVIAAAAFFLQFAPVVGFAPLVGLLGRRAQSRAPDRVTFPELWNGYVESYYWLLVVVAVAALMLALVPRNRDEPLPLAWAALLFAATVPLVENIVLMQHAVLYSFDRLKGIVPMTLVVVCAAALVTGRRRSMLLAGWLAVTVLNVVAEPDRRTWPIGPALARSNALVERARELARSCATYAIDGGVRGWVNLTLRANAFEDVRDTAALRSLVDSRHACQGVLFVGPEVGNSIYDWTSAWIYSADSGHVRQIISTPPAARPP